MRRYKYITPKPSSKRRHVAVLQRAKHKKFPTLATDSAHSVGSCLYGTLRYAVHQSGKSIGFCRFLLGLARFFVGCSILYRVYMRASCSVACNVGLALAWVRAEDCYGLRQQCYEKGEVDKINSYTWTIRTNQKSKGIDNCPNCVCRPNM